LLVSVSAGAALAGCFQLARHIPRTERAVIVTLFADSGDKYLSERFWDEE
jgi:cysteine synthase B